MCCSQVALRVDSSRQLGPQFPISSLHSEPSVFALTSLKLFIFVKTLHSYYHKIKIFPNLIIFIYITTFFLFHPNIGSGAEIGLISQSREAIDEEHRWNNSGFWIRALA